MSYAEVHDWLLFRAEKDSPLSTLKRIEVLMAVLLASFVNVNSKKKVKASDFLPDTSEPKIFGVDDLEEWDRYGV